MKIYIIILYKYHISIYIYLYIYIYINIRHSEHLLVIIKYPGTDFTVDHFKDSLSVCLFFFSDTLSIEWCYLHFFCCWIMSLGYSYSF